MTSIEKLFEAAEHLKTKNKWSRRSALIYILDSLAREQDQEIFFTKSEKTNQSEAEDQDEKK